MFSWYRYRTEVLRYEYAAAKRHDRVKKPFQYIACETACNDNTLIEDKQNIISARSLKTFLIVSLR